MLRLRRAQRRILTEKIPDLANLGAAGLVFGQFVGGQRFSVSIATVGVAIWVVMISWTLAMATNEEVE